MSNLTYLNDATVLWNLKDRYYHKLIYVSLTVRYISNTEEYNVLARIGTLSTRFLALNKGDGFNLPS